MVAADHAAEVARAFRLGRGARATGRVMRGEQGQVEELVTDRGVFAVKTSFDQPGLDGEDAEFQAAGRMTGVPAPAVLPTTGGAWHADIGGLAVRVYEWVELLPPDSTFDPAEVGKVVAAIHRTPFTGRRPQDWWYTEPVGAARWDRLVAELAAAEAPFAGDLAALRDDLVALEALITPACAVRMCHRDLWSDNLRPAASGGLCVIDWENCGLADPGHEIAGVLFEFGYASPDRARDLYRAYREAGGPGTVRSRGDFSMTIAQLGHIGERNCRLWLEADSAAELARREANVAELVGMPLTVAVIDQLLDWTAGCP